MSPAQELSETAIVDHLPKIPGLIADYVEAIHTGRSVSLEQLAKAHAVDRLGRGFDFDLIVRESRDTTGWRGASCIAWTQWLQVRCFWQSTAGLRASSAPYLRTVHVRHCSSAACSNAPARAVSRRSSRGSMSTRSVLKLRPSGTGLCTEARCTRSLSVSRLTCAVILSDLCRSRRITCR